MSDAFTLPLSGSLGLKDVTGLRDVLLAAFEGHTSIILDCAGLTDADFAIAQLLVSAKRTANAAGATLTLKADKAGPLGQLFTKTGLMGADGRALVPDLDFWASAQGQAA